MSKKSRFRGCFDKEYGKPSQALLKYASQHRYHIHWSLARKLCSLKSLLLTSKFLGLLVNSLAADEIYLVSQGEFNNTNSHAIISETKNFFRVF